jgi:hypothetical protein
MCHTSFYCAEKWMVKLMDFNKGIIMKKENKFGCALDCMDGRTKNAVTKKYGVNWVDLITEPGINKILAENVDANVIQRIKDKIHISIHYHGSEIIAIIGHAECAGNPTNKEKQIEHLKTAKKIVESFGFYIDIVLLWIENDWKTVEEIDYALVKAI